MMLFVAVVSRGETWRDGDLMELADGTSTARKLL